MGLSWLTLHSACHVLNGSTKNANYVHNKMACEEKKLSSSSSSSSSGGSGFQMPLHYPRYKKAEYETMEEWKVDLLLKQYGLTSFEHTALHEKRAYAMGAFLWPDQY